MAADLQTPIVEAFVAAYLDAWVRHDAAALTTFYAPDADVANFRGKPMHGKDDLLAFFTRGFQKNLAEIRLESPEHRIRFVADRVATMDLSATITGEKDPKGAARPPRALRCDGTLVMKPTGGWWIVVGHLRLQGLDAPPGKSAGGPANPANPAATAPADPDS
jgi:uncharacterized protein (TIGR02246 family)